MSVEKRMSRRQFLRAAALGAGLAAAGPILAACKATPTPQVIKETVIVEKVVEKVVEKPVEKVVEKVVTKVVEKEKVVTKIVKEVVPVESRGGTLTIGLHGEPAKLDPHSTSWALDCIVMMNLYDTLVWRDLDMSFKPGLAESWEFSPDGLSYTFQLRKGVKFHDGTPFTAQDVKYSFDRVVDPDRKGFIARSYLGPYTGCDILDDYTVRVNLERPHAPFLNALSLAFLGIVPQESVERLGEDFAHKPVGTGPFMLTSWVEGDHLVMEKNPDYNWAGGVFFHQGPAYLDRLIWKFIPDKTVRTGTLETGEVDVMFDPPEMELPRLRKDPDINVMTGVQPGAPDQFNLCTDTFPTDDLAVRQAMIYAVDRAAIRKTIYFDITPIAYGPISSATPYYDKAVEEYYPYDPAKAKAVLEEAGWKQGSDGVYAKEGKRLQPIILMAEGWGLYCEMMQAQWKEIGIDAELKVIGDWATLVDMAHTGKGNMMEQASTSSDPIVLSRHFHSKNFEQGMAFSRFESAELDKLLEEGEKVADPKKRQEIYSKIQKIIMDNALTIPVKEYIAKHAMRTHVMGWRQDPRGTYPWIYDVWIRR